MDAQSLREKSLELMTEKPGLTQVLTEQPISQMRELSQTLSWLGDMPALHKTLTEWYSTRMIDSRLEYNLILASYGAECFQECFALCRDYLAIHDSAPIFILAVRLCLNHLQLPQFALHFARIGLEKFPKNSDIALGEAVALSMLGDIAVYDTERRSYWAMAEDILRNLKSTRRDAAWHLAVVLGQQGKYTEACDSVLPTFMQTKDLKYFALVALLKQAVEDYKSALHVIRRGLIYHPNSPLLMGVRVAIKLAMFREGLINGFIVAQSIQDFMKAVSIDGLEGSLQSNKPQQVAGLSTIKEETSAQLDNVHEGLESLKLLKFDTSNPTVQESFVLVFEACLEIDETEMCEWLAEKIKASSLPMAVSAR
mmetsp:Transcript_28778/g.51205  ORF Transcript_28778/g.51205 Transcript_28778/m.51205 type:complete len:368 (+) Transcript_28778:1233-2336(+)